LYIDFGRGVCGTVAATGKTKIVQDTHALVPGKEHIACDPNSRSEIVVPVWRPDGSLLGVFDVDSSLESSFDEVDQEELEKLLDLVFGG
jgi:L-methionine (R)-S-oxide reductase